MQPTTDQQTLITAEGADARAVGHAGRLVTAAAVQRALVEVVGTVQGVGFRPFVYRLARSLGLAGSVHNHAGGVSIELQGAQPSIDAFLARMVDEAPAHARIRNVAVQTIGATEPRAGFAVDASRVGGPTAASVPPDIATCDDCLRELFDPSDRRYRYPFINCTACGPRFTIARGIPYDRASTSMARFTMCPRCQAEYDDPANRRFHAQPNACPSCGPHVELINATTGTRTRAHEDPIAAAIRALDGGAIVAVKGLGGYHLACRADDADAVKRLRRKERDDKPFALMVRDLAAAKQLVELNVEERRLIASVARPIVLARAKPGVPIAPDVAPERDELGVMLPYTPIHHLLLAASGPPLVMTSGNRSDEPIAYRDGDAFARLASIAELFLTHDRVIEGRCEDSVARVVHVAGTSQPLFVRRSRGYVPQPIALPVRAAEPILAAGGQLKNTACVVRGDEAIVGPHTGDLEDVEAFAGYAVGVDHLARLSGTSPVAVAHDLHPEYLSTKYALERLDLTPIAVQHHHAHLAACLAEHGETGVAVGVIFDGAGYGTDGTIWGGEILVGDLGGFTRAGHLRAVGMPGGEAAVREPWRMACAWLTAAHGREPSMCAALRDAVDEPRWSAVSGLSHGGALAPMTTSIGRLLDACAAICGMHPRVTFEGQAAMAFEAAARRASALGRDDMARRYPVAVNVSDTGIEIDPREMVLAIEADAESHRDVAEISCRAHFGLVYAAQLGAQRAAEQAGARTIVLSGGVFQNVLMLEALSTALARQGFRVLVPRQLPPNDGGLSFGQAAVAAWQRRGDVPGHTRPSR